MSFLEPDGIICDYCAMIYKDEFIYYDVTSYLIKILNNLKINNAQEFNNDMCSNCYDQLIEKVMSNISVHKKGFIKCDLSQQYRNGTFDYRLLLFNRISVNKQKDQVDVEQQIMDLNVIDFSFLQEKIDFAKDKVKKQEEWS